MAIPVFIRSLLPKSSVYFFSSDEIWESVGKEKFPRFPWLSNQTGLQVAVADTYMLNPAQDLPGLLTRLPFIVEDLVVEAVQEVGLKHTTSINSLRWLKLSQPRPTFDVGTPCIAWAKRGKNSYGLSIQADGRGGWHAVPEIPDTVREAGNFWNYTLYVDPSTPSERMLPCAIKRIVTSTLDHLYCYDSKDCVAKSYLCYAQPRMKQIWEKGDRHETNNQRSC